MAARVRFTFRPDGERDGGGALGVYGRVGAWRACGGGVDRSAQGRSGEGLWLAGGRHRGLRAAHPDAVAWNRCRRPDIPKHRSSVRPGIDVVQVPDCVPGAPAADFLHGRDAAGGGEGSCALAGGCRAFGRAALLREYAWGRPGRIPERFYFAAGHRNERHHLRGGGLRVGDLRALHSQAGARGGDGSAAGCRASGGSRLRTGHGFCFSSSPAQARRRCSTR